MPKLDQEVNKSVNIPPSVYRAFGWIHRPASYRHTHRRDSWTLATGPLPLCTIPLVLLLHGPARGSASESRLTRASAHPACSSNFSSTHSPRGLPNHPNLSSARLRGAIPARLHLPPPAHAPLLSPRLLRLPARATLPSHCHISVLPPQLLVMASTTPTRRPYHPNSNPNPPAARDGSPDQSASPAVAQQPTGDQQPGGPRRTSFSFLRKKSSADSRTTSRSASGSGAKMSKKQKALAQEEALRKQREAAMLPKQPPRLPTHSALPQIETFGGEGYRPDSVAIVSNRVGNYSHNFSRPSGDYSSSKSAMASSQSGAAAVAPPTASSYMDFDPYPRTESMTHRGRYSYASSQISTVNSPRRVRRRKDPTPFK